MILSVYRLQAVGQVPDQGSDWGAAMANFETLARWAGRSSALPPVAARFSLSVIEDPEAGAAPIDVDAEPHAIAAFVCIIEYEGEQRLITCRRYDIVGEFGYVGAICHAARGYRQFRCDRIQAVFDATTGEVLGDGHFFNRFDAQSRRERAPTWGLTPSRKATLVAGLNVLAFMARCDGHWHRLETTAIENFVCSMWLRKEWPGEPPLAEIVAHSQRLAPDSDTFFRALQHYAQSSSSTRVLRRSIGDLIAADGVICSAETTWGAEIDSFFCEAGER
jgi:hypothetical protein